MKAPDAKTTSLRHEALERIYAVFEAWSSELAFACRKGCAVCCTQGVTICETEGERIIEFVRRNDRLAWLTAQLSHLPPRRSPTCTTNDFACACLQGQDIDPGEGSFAGICPFLRDRLCTIYPVRPFSCRCFVSSTVCQPDREAVLPSYYLSASTAVSQLIEHLDQGRYWGNMLHLLDHLSPAATRDHRRPVAPSRQSPAGLLLARPLPGFLIGAEDHPLVAPLLEEIFAAPLGGRTLLDLLNGG